MNWNSPPSLSPVSSDIDVGRRSVLAAAAAAMIPTSGCATRVRSVVDDGGEQLSLRLGTLPADDDLGAIRIARHLESNLRAVGIDVTLDVRQSSEFLEGALLDHEFDLFVDRYPVDTGLEPDPDLLYEALHSEFATEAGRQNPFGFTDMELDEALETQRRAEGKDRRAAVRSVLEIVSQRKPFEPICRPIEHRLARPERIGGWSDGWIGTELDYLSLEPVDDGTTDGDDGAADRLHALLLDSRPSQNSNPLSATMRERDVIVDLLYDSLGVTDREAGAIRPWLAERWEWETERTGADTDAKAKPRTTATIALREDARFHDGEPVTAADVDFTYRFLADTALGDAPVASPAPRYRGLAAAVDDVQIRGDRELLITVDAGPEVARRIATVPILPAHVWLERLEEYGIDPDLGYDPDSERDRHEDPTEAADVSAPQGRWDLVDGDVEPVGSGPYRLVDRSEREFVTLERHDGHFAVEADPDGGNVTAETDGEDVEIDNETDAGLDGATTTDTAVGDETADEQDWVPTPSFEELYFDIDPSAASAIGRVVEGSADLTASMLEPTELDRIPESDTSGGGSLRRLETRSPSFYYLGFNTRQGPVSNVHFRRAVAHLLDKAWIADDVFHGEADPIATPVVDEWVPDADPDLTWDGADPIAPFPGEAGELDVEAARTLFENRGFQYDDGGRLLRRY